MKVEVIPAREGYSIRFKGKSYGFFYPGDIWSKLPADIKDALIDNLSFMQSMELPYLLSSNGLSSNRNAPFFPSTYFKAVLNHIPFAADIDGKPSRDQIRKYLKISYRWNGPPRKPSTPPKCKERCVIPLTFGKDSLLSYAVSEEIGLDPVAITTKELGLPSENMHREDLIRSFRKEFRKNVSIIEDGTLNLSDWKHHGLPMTQFGYANTISAYVMAAIPFNYYYNAKYTVIGNEQSCNESYVTTDGYRVFPVYDQTKFFMRECDAAIKAISGNALSAVSIVEPLQEIAIMKLLHSRYPKYAKYQMSCFPDDHRGGRKNRWCMQCSKCARMAIFCKAMGIGLSSVGLSEEIFSKRNRALFSLFGKARGDVSFDISGVGRDEQLFAFYMAYRNGEKNQLMDLFKEKLLHEAKSREDELYKKFLGISTSDTIPMHIKPKVLSIYKEELK